MLVAACDRGDVRWTESGGDVAGGYRMLDYEVTSERYRQWFAAHRALEGVEIGEPVDVDLRNLNDKDIDRVVHSIQTHAAARTSIEGVGMTVRDFVLTTIALAQPWAASSQAVDARVNVADPGPTVTRAVTNARLFQDGVPVFEDDGRGRRWRKNKERKHR